MAMTSEVMNPNALDRADRCFWLKDVLTPADEAVQPASGDIRTDVCIVGGGYAGLWTAIRLKEADPAVDVCILEADLCGTGCSGRNSGMVLGQWAKIKSLEAMFGLERAIRLCDLFNDAGAGVNEFCQKHGVSIDYKQCGWLWGLSHESQRAAWGNIVEALTERGRPIFHYLDAQGIEERLGPYHRVKGAILDPSAATIHPGKLVRGLTAIARKMGVRIFEKSPMRSFTRTAPLMARTDHAVVRAGKIVLTMGAWSSKVRALRSSIFVIASDDAMTAPIPEILEENGYRHDNGPLYGDTQIFIGGFRVTADNRLNAGIGGGLIAFGAFPNARFTGRSTREADIRMTVRRVMPNLAEIPFIDSWYGPIDRTRTGLPIVTRLPGAENVFVGYGLSGNGITGTYMMGKMLSSLVMGRDDAWSRSDIATALDPWLPPEPFRYVGAHAIRTAIRRRDLLSHSGQEPGALVKALCRMAPSGVTTSRAVKRAAPA